MRACVNGLCCIGVTALHGIERFNMVRKGSKNDIAGHAAFIERLFGLTTV